MNTGNTTISPLTKMAPSIFSYVLIALFATACGAGQYGFSRTYKPNSEEKAYDKKGTAFGFNDLNSDPADYDGKLIAWFGVVHKVTRAADGRYQIQISHRKHTERHLCDSESSSSCKVTVHFKSSGNFSVLLNLLPIDVQAGLDKVQPGSLLRVFGTVRCKENDDEQMECDYDDLGGVLLDGEFYRQWPARHFVSNRASGTMRR